MFVSCDLLAYRCISCPCLFVYSWSIWLMSFSRTTLTFNLPKCLSLENKLWTPNFDSTVPPPNSSTTTDKQHVSRWWFQIYIYIYFFFKNPLWWIWSHFELLFFSDGWVQPTNHPTTVSNLVGFFQRKNVRMTCTAWMWKNRSLGTSKGSNSQKVVIIWQSNGFRQAYRSNPLRIPWDEEVFFTTWVVSGWFVWQM